ncbi:MAG: rod shape-determining protein MreD [Flavobacteriales bacterium]|nr:rod shape-determining protein MreD [Flavobacteriales bacterium]
MSRQTILHIVRFIALWLVQGLLLSNVVLMGGNAQVYLYTLFIIMLPLRMSTGFAMLLAFLLGLGIDMFYDSPGLHTSAAVVAAFVRPYFIQLLTPRDDYDINDRATISKMGLFWFVRLCLGVMLVHSFWLFLLETFSFSGIGSAMLKALSTAFITLIVGVVTVFLFSRKKD